MSPCRALLVDDEVDFVQTMVKRLKRNKRSVEAVHGGADACVISPAIPATSWSST